MSLLLVAKILICQRFWSTSNDIASQSSDPGRVPRHAEVAVETVERSHVLRPQLGHPQGRDVGADVRGAIALRDGAHTVLQTPQDHRLPASIEFWETDSLSEAWGRAHLCWRDVVGLCYAHNRRVPQLGAFGQGAVPLRVHTTVTANDEA